MLISSLKLIRYLVLSFLAALSFVLVAEERFTLAEVDLLDSLPAIFWDMSTAERLDWLKQSVESEVEPLAKYQLTRTLIVELYAASQQKEAEQACYSIVPLKDDLFLRSYCIEIVNIDLDEFKAAMMVIIAEARAANNDDMVAELLAKMAWSQSKNGDIVGAFKHYEEALKTVSPKNYDLLNSIMFETASSYIAHGNDVYVEKGIELLAKINVSTSTELFSEKDPERRSFLMWYEQFAHFNTGIAYILHLHNYEKALEAFDKVSELDSSVGFNAASYSAFAAAKLGKYDLAKMYLNQVEGRQEENPIVDRYLTCYRQLALQYWSPDIKLSACLSLFNETATEVKMDLYKRLSDNPDSDVALYGLRQLKNIYVETLEPQLRNQLTQAASNAEVERLEKESELKSLVLDQQKKLQEEIDAKHTSQQRFFIALFFILLFFILFVVSQLRQKKKLARQYQKMSVRDSLTKLGNRRFLEQQIERELSFVQRAIKNGELTTLGIYVFDIDHFKKVNDNHGHLVGDEVLKEISQRVKSIIRDTDLLVRWGGEEFVYVARMDNAARKFELADRILKTINSKPFVVSDENLSLDISCTIGITEFPFIDTNNVDVWTRLISLADAALYYGKSLGRNCWIAINNETMSDEAQIEQLMNQPLEQFIEDGVISVCSSLENN